MKGAVACLVALALVGVERQARACAGCSNPNLPTARAANTGLGPGEIGVGFNLTATTMHVVHPEACPEIGPVCRQRNEPPQQHDQRFYVGELRPIVALGLRRPSRWRRRSRFGSSAPRSRSAVSTGRRSRPTTRTSTTATRH